jgi:hypothetical protein
MTESAAGALVVMGAPGDAAVRFVGAFSTPPDAKRRGGGQVWKKPLVVPLVVPSDGAATLTVGAPPFLAWRYAPSAAVSVVDPP